MENLPASTLKTASKHPPGIKLSAIPRTLTKKAIRTYFEIDYRRYKKLVNERIISKMGLDVDEHRRIKEYDVDQTKVLVAELQLSDEELIRIAKYM